jgi:hypothetical protein
MDHTDALREQLTRLLRGQDAHMDFLDAVADFPDDALNQRAPNVDSTPWHLAEHVRITQWDILEYIRDPSHVSPDWPTGYWPAPDATATPETFAATIDSFARDREALLAIVRDPTVDLLGPCRTRHGTRSRARSAWSRTTPPTTPASSRFSDR